MAYQVTKRISGGDYRYHVEGYRDPETGRQRTRWQYLGRVVDGVTVTPPTRRGERVTQDKIVEATAELLESRDASRVTVAVIAKHAGISQATFYRYFRDRKAAFTAALSYLCDQTISALPSLEDHAIGTPREESYRIFTWLESLHRSMLRQRAFRWSYSNSDRSKAKAQIERSMLKVDGYAMLAAYLRRLDAAGIAHIEDADKLAEAVLGVCRALIRSGANEVEHEEEHPVELVAVFPVIERAVFCRQSGKTT
jgi:AcrR family transcriptional regulator